jgi:RNA polymerase sigma-70 factor (ECF subfamily)
VAERDTEFTAFFRAEYPAVVGTLFLVLHDREQARDVAQDAFIQLFARWSRISHYERPEAWVRRVGIRMAVRAARRERRRSELERRVPVGSSPRPVDVDIVRAVRMLPAAQRAAVALFYLEDRPVSDVASILGCSDVTARVHLHRARNRLAQLLGERELTEEVRDVS